LGIGEIWDLIILSPAINVLIVLSYYLFNSFGLAIIALTIAVNVLMYPLTMKQLRATKAMQSLQPKLSELQKKYAKDRQKLAQEQMKLYKESGMNPAGCLVPMLIQMPIWIALFQSIIRLLAVTPEDFLSLSHYLYSWPVVHSMVPLAANFLWLNLAEGNLVMALLVGGTMWVSQKMTMTPTADPKQQAQGRMMLWMMPIMFGFFCLTFPSGLALFWAASNAIRIAIQYYTTGWGALVPSPAGKQALFVRDRRYKSRIALHEAPLKDADIGADIVETSSTQEEGADYEESGDERQDSGGGYPERFKSIRRDSGRSRDYRHKRR